MFAESAGLFLVEAVKLGGCLGFGVKTDHLGHRRLHAKREFVRLDSGIEFRIVRILLCGKRVQSMNEIELQLLLVTRHVTGGLGKVERVIGIDSSTLPHHNAGPK